jgi:ppGpp synthetase/RelA/SpoT-type nucleotidyltranferase
MNNEEILRANIRPSQSYIRIGRLEKRIKKLTQQRDHYKELYDYYQKVISLQPFLERRYKDYLERKEELDNIKSLKARVKEQAILIQKLLEECNAKSSNIQ